MRKLRLNEEDIHLYKDKKTGNIYYFDGTKLVQINPESIRKAEQSNREKNDVTKETESDREARIANANAKLSDEKTIETGMQKARAAAYKSRDNARKREAEKRRKEKEAEFNAQYPKGTNEIKLSIKDFIKTQVKEKTSYSYSRFNKKYNNVAGGVIKPGRYKEENRNIPTINVYFDQSSSWGSNDIKNGNQIISVLADYQRKKQIKVNVFYFANTVTTTPPGGGGTNAKPVMEHIIETKPDNVIIMTDDDTTKQNLPKVVVPGAVWFIWKNGLKSEALLKNLSGVKLTKSFNLG